MKTFQAASLGAAFALAMAGSVAADPLSKKTDIDFYQDVMSRDLHGLATRSDGRLVAGPVLTDLAGKPGSDLLWCLEPGAGGKWLVGGGPGGRVLEISVDFAAATYSSKEVVKLGDVQVYALKSLADGSILAGTSPGGLYLIKNGKVAAHAVLPAVSIFDLCLLPDGKSALAATGDPGRIYRIDLAKFASGGAAPNKATNPAALEARGLALFGEVSDRNIRRIARLSDGTIAAGSAPKGNIYIFGAGGGSPFIADENRDAEVTDLLPDPAGGYYASIVYSGGDIHPVQSGIQLLPAVESGVPVMGANPSPAPQPNASGARSPGNSIEILAAAPQVEKFPGRSTLKWFSTEGFPEILASRGGVAFYRMARQGNLLVISGGELGEISGFDLARRLSLTFPGSASSQVNAIEPVPGSPGKFLAIRNNAPGVAVIDFDASSPRTAETKRVDLGAPARLGALRFNRELDVDPGQLTLSIRTTNAANETDGWSPWVPMADSDGWRAQVPAGRYAEVKVSLPADAKPTLELDKASLYYLTQNHRPQLQDFRMLTPNFAIVVPPEMPPPVTTTVGQLLQASDRDSDRRKTGFLGSQIFSSPGTRVAFWTVTDADGDNVAYTFSIRREGDPDWTDIAVDTRDSFVQFDTLHLKEGTWFTRLVTKEAAPRPAGERLSVTFETDDMVVDHTPPDIEEATVRRDAGKVAVTVRGRDALSLLDSAEFTFNNGVHEVVEQPASGILDGREETFILELPAERLAGATSVEVTLYDSSGNGATRRLSL
ncbi:MAG TPA: hypothetical protein VII43_03590 [Opitutaceae bacterium]